MHGTYVYNYVNLMAISSPSRNKTWFFTPWTMFQHFETTKSGIIAMFHGQSPTIRSEVFQHSTTQVIRVPLANNI